MGHRLSTELIESLRVVLQKLEAQFASPEDQPVLAELKRILLLRIADLEAIELARESESADTEKPSPDKHEASEQEQPLPIPIIIEESQVQAPNGKESLKKLD